MSHFIMKTKLIVGIAALVFIFSGTLWAEDVVKRFVFTTVNGETIDSSNLSGMPVVVYFVSDW